MKNKISTIISIILLSIVALLLILLLVFLLNNRNVNFGNFINFKLGHSVSSKLVIDDEYDNIFDVINIDSTSSDIDIKSSESNNIRVIVYGNTNNTNLDIVDNTLYITTNDKVCTSFCFNVTISKIEVYLPEDYLGSLNITNKYGNINIDEFNNMKLSVNGSAGDINIVSVLSIDIKNNYGDIKITGHVSNIDVVNDCGDIVINNVDVLNVVNKFGDININVVNNYLSVSNDFGDINIGILNIEKDSSIINRFGDIVLGPTSKIYIKAKTSLGDVKIKNNYNKEDIVLTIQGQLGDIKVNN